jgi:cytochrome b561
MIDNRQALRGYGTPSRVLHWLTAILVLATIPAGLTMIQEGLNRPLQDTLFIFHKNVGVVILLLVLTRLAVRVASPPPPLPDTVPQWQRRIAAVSHAGLYVLLLVMACSGYIRVRAGGFPVEGLDALGVPHLVPKSKGLEETAKAVHSTTRYLIIGLVLIHIGAALQHAILRRDGVFHRMWPPWRT